MSQSILKSVAFDRVMGNAKPKLFHPTAKAFDPAPWLALLSEQNVATRDAALASSAVYFGGQNKALRDQLIDPAIQEFGGVTLLRLAVARANRNLLLVQSRLAKSRKRSSTENSIGLLDLAELGRIGGNPMQPDLTVDDVLTATIDTFPHWLPHVVERLEMADIEGADLNIGGAKVEQALSMERGFKTLWQSTLWEGRHLETMEGVISCVWDDLDSETTWAAWEHRQLSLLTQEMLSEAGAVRRGELPRIPDATIRRTVTGIQRNGRAVRLKLGAPGAKSKRRHSMKLRTLEASYLNDFLDEPIVVDAGVLTARLLIQALCIVCDVAEILLGECRRSEVLNAADLRALSLPIGRAALKVALRDALAITDSLAEAVLAYLTTNITDLGRAFSEGVWHRPLVSGPNNDELLILAPAAIHGAPLRLAERWLIAGARADKLSESPLGTAYEASVRRLLAEAIERNAIVTDAEVAPHSLKRGAVGEEIDVLLRIGNLLLVGEVKCFLVPAEPLERFYHIGKLEEAAEQVGRKAEWLRGNRNVLTKHLSGLPEDLTKLKIEPLVILNNGVGLGAVIGNVVVTDAHTLLLYMREGSYVAGKLIGPNGEEIEHSNIFYVSQPEAEARLLSTLADPPALRKWKKAIRWRMDDFPAVEGRMKIVAHDVDYAAMQPASVQKDAAFLNALGRGKRHRPARK